LRCDPRQGGGWWQFTSRNFQLSKSSIELPTASFAPARAPQILIKILPAPETLGYPTDAAFPLQGTPGRCFYLPWMDHPRPSIHPLRTRWQSDFKPCRSGSFCFRQFFLWERWLVPLLLGVPRRGRCGCEHLPTRISKWKAGPERESGASHHMRRSVQTWPEWRPHLNLSITLQPEAHRSLVPAPASQTNQTKKSNTKSATICNSVRLDPLK
jgi:hypothetical protein